jgi:glycogen synthase
MGIGKRIYVWHGNRNLDGIHIIEVIYRMIEMKTKADYFFEVSWEVCNKVGGIYTVISSKAQQMLDFYKFNYYVIGPYFPGEPIADKFKQMTPPDFLKHAFERMHSLGINCYFGNWLIDGEPNTILIDYSNYQNNRNIMKSKLWESFKIDSLNTQYHDYDEPMLWSTCAGILIQEIKEYLKDKKIVAQFHEWLAGGGLLYLKQNNVKVGTVFTTHATMLGRTMSGNNMDLYGQLDNINPEEEAYKLGIQSKFLTEKACAQNADVFTTVSEITGIEAEKFFGKKPDVLLPNGLDTRLFPTFDESSIQHKLLKGKIKRFLMFYFFPYYQFELDETFIFFLAGRYEFQNKGIDVYIEALSKLNEELKKTKSNKTIIAFVWVPTGVKEIKPDLMENKTFYEDIEDSISDLGSELKNRLVYGLVGNKEVDTKFILGETLSKEIIKKIARLKCNGNPPLCTHNLYNEEKDAIISSFKANNLNNSEEDRVKVIFYPIYLTGADHLTDLSYYEAITASHLGVFPSYYEPWGYTPMETGSLGVASVTTDLAGFGRYIKKFKKDTGAEGIFIVPRENKSYQEIVDSLASVFIKFTSFSKQERIENKLQAKKLADTADWNNLAEFYIKAHNMAAEKIEKN